MLFLTKWSLPVDTRTLISKMCILHSNTFQKSPWVETFESISIGCPISPDTAGQARNDTRPGKMKVNYSFSENSVEVVRDFTIALKYDLVIFEFPALVLVQLPQSRPSDEPFVEALACTHICIVLLYGRVICTVSYIFGKGWIMLNKLRHSWAKDNTFYEGPLKCQFRQRTQHWYISTDPSSASKIILSL